MSDTSNSVIPFEPRPKPEPELTSCELRLLDGGLEMTVYDEAGDIAAVLPLGFLSVPEGFDLERLRSAWTRWREASAIAS